MRAHGLTAAAGLLAAGAGLSVMAAFLVGQTPTTPPSDATLAISAEAATPLLSLPDAPRVLIFGGSYTYGIGASAPEQGFAYKLAENEGWDAVIDGVPGTGYLDPGPHRTGAYPARMGELDADETFDLILIQGSTHDFAMDHSRLPAAVTATLAAANEKLSRHPYRDARAGHLRRLPRAHLGERPTRPSRGRERHDLPQPRRRRLVHRW